MIFVGQWHEKRSFFLKMPYICKLIEQLFSLLIYLFKTRIMTGLLRKIFSLGMGCLWMGLPSVFAQKNLLKNVLLTINSEDGVFQIGDTIKVYGSLTAPCDKPLTLKLYEGGTRHYETMHKQPKSRSVELSSTPRLIYQDVFKKQGSMILSVTDGSNAASMVGFIVAPERFRPGFDVPNDFTSYWAAQKAWLRQSEPQVTLQPVEIADAQDAQNYDLFSIEISMPEGYPVRGYLAKPKHAQAKSIPAVLWVHAAGVAGHWCRASAKNALKYAKKGQGVIAIDFNAHGYPEDKPQQYYVDLENGPLKGYSERPLVDREHFYFRLMFLRALRALDYVCGLPEWDGERVLVYGESQGGAQSAALAGLDSRVGAAVLNVPAMTDVGGFLQGRQSSWPAPYEKYVKTKLGKRILPYFDGAIFLQFSKAKLFMVSGMIDETCPGHCVHAAYNAAASMNKQIFPFPYRWHSGTNPPFNKQWDATVAKAREDFINDYLK